MCNIYKARSLNLRMRLYITVNSRHELSVYIEIEASRLKQDLPGQEENNCWKALGS